MNDHIRKCQQEKVEWSKVVSNVEVMENLTKKVKQLELDLKDSEEKRKIAIVNQHEAEYATRKIKTEYERLKIENNCLNSLIDLQKLTIKSPSIKVIEAPVPQSSLPPTLTPTFSSSPGPEKADSVDKTGSDDSSSSTNAPETCTLPPPSWPPLTVPQVQRKLTVWPRLGLLTHLPLQIHLRPAPSPLTSLPPLTIPQMHLRLGLQLQKKN